MFRFKAFYLLFVLAVLCFSQNLTAGEKQIHNELNEAVVSFYIGFEELSIDKLANVYTDDAVFISESRKDPIILGKDNILALYKKFFAKVRQKAAHIEVDFRVIDRKINVNSATDVGYYLVRVHPRDDKGEPVSEFAGKFVNRYAYIDKKWLIAVDSNTRSKPEFYYNSKPTANLYFGRQFIEPDTEKPAESIIDDDINQIQERPL
ncbi:YybH family protein [Shewanella maritima]|uniref:YybH family protein n=1 Tax=Shewanella maritima TaxID=2520507 RepID=UPI003735773F